MVGNDCTCEISEKTRGALGIIVLPAPHIAPSVLLKDYQTQVDVVNDVTRMEGDYDSASRPRGIAINKFKGRTIKLLT
jgi:hypothetical protein